MKAKLVPRTLLEIRKWIAAELEQVGISNPFDEAKWLILTALEMDPGIFITQPERDVPSAEIDQINHYLHRRIQREPLSRIRGEREFWSLSFSLNKATLDPRPDSEILVEEALKLIPHDKPQRILDLGTGSGCLLISLLHERYLCEGIGVDLSPLAAQQAFSNAHRNHVDARSLFIVSSWADALPHEQFHLVVSNPPYIPTTDKNILDPEVSQYDPKLALYGGDDGLECYRQLVTVVPSLLCKGGFLLLEIGFTQARDVQDIFAQDPTLAFHHKATDFEGRDRVLVFQKQ